MTLFYYHLLLTHVKKIPPYGDRNSPQNIYKGTYRQIPVTQHAMQQKYKQFFIVCACCEHQTSMLPEIELRDRRNPSIVASVRKPKQKIRSVLREKISDGCSSFTTTMKSRQHGILFIFKLKE